MKLLVLGGTQFVGRALVDEALARGHEITVFNRNQSEPTGQQLFGDRVRHLVGDRGDRGDDASADLSALAGAERWDVVLDVAGYYPSAVRRTAEALAGRVGLYCFISSTSVFGDSIEERDGAFKAQGLPAASVAQVLAAGGMDSGEGTYGSRKVVCEDTLRELLPDSTLIIRPGYIVGPSDPFDRWCGWIWRAQQGGRMLAPAPAERQMQWVDVRDLAEFTLSRCEALDPGTYNVVGPAPGMAGRPTLSQLLEAAAAATGVESEVVFVEEETMRAAGMSFDLAQLWEPALVTDESELPPVEEAATFVQLEHAASNERAVAAGLSFRSLEETVAGAMERSGALFGGGEPREAGAVPWGLAPADEARVLGRPRARL